MFFFSSLLLSLHCVELALVVMEKTATVTEHPLVQTNTRRGVCHPDEHGDREGASPWREGCTHPPTLEDVGWKKLWRMSNSYRKGAMHSGVLSVSSKVFSFWEFGLILVLYWCLPYNCGRTRRHKISACGVGQLWSCVTSVTHRGLLVHECGWNRSLSQASSVALDPPESSFRMLTSYSWFLPRRSWTY